MVARVIEPSVVPGAKWTEGQETAQTQLPACQVRKGNTEQPGRTNSICVPGHVENPQTKDPYLMPSVRSRPVELIPKQKGKTVKISDNVETYSLDFKGGPS